MFSRLPCPKVKVNLINDDILEHAVLIRFAAISPEEFITKYQTAFIKYVKMLLSLQRSKDIFILGIQKSSSATRAPRSTTKSIGQSFVNLTMFFISSRYLTTTQSS